MCSRRGSGQSVMRWGSDGKMSAATWREQAVDQGRAGLRSAVKRQIGPVCLPGWHQQHFGDTYTVWVSSCGLSACSGNTGCGGSPMGTQPRDLLMAWLNFLAGDFCGGGRDKKNGVSELSARCNDMMRLASSPRTSAPSSGAGCCGDRWHDRARSSSGTAGNHDTAGSGSGNPSCSRSGSMNIPQDGRLGRHERKSISDQRRHQIPSMVFFALPFSTLASRCMRGSHTRHWGGGSAISTSRNVFSRIFF